MLSREFMMDRLVLQFCDALDEKFEQKKAKEK